MDIQIVKTIANGSNDGVTITDRHIAKTIWKVYQRQSATNKKNMLALDIRRAYELAYLVSNLRKDLCRPLSK